jgi:hypothetical protein
MEEVMATAIAEVTSIATKYREASAKRIKELLTDWTRNVLELGAELSRVRDTFPAQKDGNRPGWRDWITNETGITDRHVRTLIRVADKFGSRGDAVAAGLGLKVMEFLTRETVPDSAKEEIMDRVSKGERIGHGKAIKIAEAHRLPGPAAANKQAKEEGRPVLASDGNIYFGTSPEKAKEGEDRRTMIWGVRRALDTLGGIQLTPTQFLNYALPHQLWNTEEEQVIKRALKWLSQLDVAWDKWERS